MTRLWRWHNRHEEQLNTIEANMEGIMATLADLDAKIASLPQETATAVEAVIPAQAVVDTQPQIDALAQVPAQTATLVQQALAGRPAPA